MKRLPLEPNKPGCFYSTRNTWIKHHLVLACNWPPPEVAGSKHCPHWTLLAFWTPNSCVNGRAFEWDGREESRAVQLCFLQFNAAFFFSVFWYQNFSLLSNIFIVFQDSSLVLFQGINFQNMPNSVLIQPLLEYLQHLPVWASLISHSVKNLSRCFSPGTDSWAGWNLGEGNDNLLQNSCLENPHWQRSLAGYSPWSHKSRTRFSD